jgi:ubiquitin carboxyl-terminal hydrolase 5/13
MNSVVQVLATLPELRAGWADPAVGRALFETAPKTGLPDDLLAQTARLVSGLNDTRYALDTAAAAAAAAAHAHAPAAAAAPAAEAVVDASAPAHMAVEDVPKPIPSGPGARCGYLVPRTYRTLVGKGHPDFSSARQQDATHFLEWLFALYDRAYQAGKASGRINPVAVPAAAMAASFSSAAAASGSIPVPPPPSHLVSFPVESRTHCLQSDRVRYGTSNELFLRLRIPVEAATNKAEVDAAKAALTAEKTAAAAAVAGAGGEADPKRARTEATGAGASSSSSSSSAPLPRYKVPFGACVQAWAGDEHVPDYLSPATGAKGAATRRSRIAAFPPYLVVVLNRYEYAADWTPVKIDAEVELPLDLDLEAAAPGSAGAGGAAYGNAVASLRGTGLQPGETALVDASPVAAAATAAAAAPAPAAAAAAVVVPDDEVVATLVSMGFPEGACKRAAVATANAGAEAAMEWIIMRTEDPDFADPYVLAAAAPPASAAAASAAAAAAAPEPDPSSVATIADMGFSEARAKVALRATGGDVERAMEWLFSHTEEEDDGMGAGAAAAAAPAAAASASSSAGAAGAAGAADASAAGRYTLVGFVSHMGTSTASGHYVAHIRKDARGEPASRMGEGAAVCGEGGGEGGAAGPATRWHIFNDGKVAESAKPPLSAGFVYLYRRVVA